MPSTNFTSGTVITSTWLNGIDDFVFDNVPANTGAGLMGFSNTVSYGDGTTGKALRAAMYGYPVLNDIPTTEWSAIIAGTSTYDAGPTINAALALYSSVVLHPGKWNTSVTINVGVYQTLKGSGPRSTTLNITADVAGIQMRLGYNEVSGMYIFRNIATLPVHTHAGIIVGKGRSPDPAERCDRATIADVYVDQFGTNGIEVIDGNLGTIRNTSVRRCINHGIYFTTDQVDNNAWTFDGYIDLSNNLVDGLRFEDSVSLSDPNGSRSHFIKSVSVQSNGRYGLYSGTPGNVGVIYGESNTTQDLALGTNAFGNQFTLVTGAYTDSSTGSSVSVSSANANGVRAFKTKTNFGGGAGKGLRIIDDDGTAGYWDIEKDAARSLRVTLQGTSGAGNVYLDHASAGVELALNVDGRVLPMASNTWSLGNGSLLWSQLWCADGTIHTSDAKEKQQIECLNEQEKLVAIKLKSLIRKFKYNAAVDKKQDKARIHVGIIAQDVKLAFAEYGLNADDYAIYCEDIQEDGSSKLAIRYDELYAFIITAL